MISRNIIRIMKRVRPTALQTRNFSYSPSSDDDILRAKKLKEIYKEIEGLDPSLPIFKELAESGRLWERHFEPFKWPDADKDYFQNNAHVFNNIDAKRKSVKIDVRRITESMQFQMTHQSVAFEGNKLQRSDAKTVLEALPDSLWRLTEQGSTLIEDKIPPPEQLLNGREPNEVIEVRNHLLAQRSALLHTAPESEFALDQLQYLHRIMMLDTPFYDTVEWGKQIKAGTFRRLPMQAHGYPLTVYPYPIEVPALMNRFVTFVNQEVKMPTLHPVMSATKAMSALMHIHPFFDGNGRMGRLVMAMMMLKYNVLPVVFLKLPRSYYIDAIYAFQNGQRAVLYDLVAETVDDMLLTHLFPDDATKDNFKASLDLVTQSIAQCDFMCFDLELTGLWFDRWSFIDSLEDRYPRWRDSARQFLPNQFGLCTFSWDEEHNRYIARPFNFYVFRGSYKSVDPSFLSLSSSLKFLTEHKFDFNKWLYKGIPYLSKSHEAVLLDQISSRQKITEEARDTVALSGADKEFIEQIVAKVTAWFESGEGETLRLERAYNGYQRRIIYQELGRRFNEVLHIDAVAMPGSFNKWMEFKKLDQEQRRKFEEEKRRAELDEVREASGFRVVIDAMAESGKPILGHNMLLDCLHMFEQFRTTLPDNLNEFKQKFHTTFPQILDTKTLSSTHQALTSILQSTHLGDLHTTVSKAEEFSNKTAIHLEEAFSSYIDGDAYHEAGFDAYATGAVFVALANKIGCGARVDFNHEELSLARNKFFVMHYDGLLNVAGPDDVPDRNNVFFLHELTKEVKTNDLVDLFSRISKVRVKWTGDTTAFVIFTSDTGAPCEVNEEMRQQILKAGRKYGIGDFASYTSQNGAATTDDNTNNNNNNNTPRRGTKRKRDEEQKAPAEEEAERPTKKAKKEFPECIIL